MSSPTAHHRPQPAPTSRADDRAVTRATTGAGAWATVAVCAALALTACGPAATPAPVGGSQFRPASHSATTGTGTVTDTTAAPTTTPPGSTATRQRAGGPPRLRVPAAAPGELARTLANYTAVPGQQITLKAPPAVGTRYQVVSACSVAKAGSSVSYTVTVRDARPGAAPTSGEGPSLMSSTLPCTGQAESVDLGYFDVLATVEMTLPDVAGAHGYAVLTPSH